MTNAVAPRTNATTTAKPRTIKGVEPVGPRATRIQRWVMVAMTVIPLAGLVLAIVQWWGQGVSGLDLGLLLGFYAFTGFGITLGYHRLFTHKSFEVPTALRVLIGVAGSMAMQGSLIDWVATHRRHHAYSDQYGDPHSPHLDPADGIPGVFKGLWHAHLGWLFSPAGTVHERWAPDLLDEPAIRRVSAWFPAIVVAGFVLPALIGGLATMSIAGALSGLLWGGIVRVFLLHHVTWSINSICHFYGTRPFRSHDESRNNPVMALLAFGEGWHNAHHAFPSSARHGLRWWEFDSSWVMIRTLEILGLARNVKLPSPTQLARKTVA